MLTISGFRGNLPQRKEADADALRRGERLPVTAC